MSCGRCQIGSGLPKSWAAESGMRDVGARGGLPSVGSAMPGKEVLAADTGFQGTGRQMFPALQGSWLMRVASPQAQPSTGESKTGESPPGTIGRRAGKVCGQVARPDHGDGCREVGVCYHGDTGAPA